MSASTTPLLRIAGLQAFYGESHILHGIDLDIHAGELVTLLGRNGSGRTTTLSPTAHREAETAKAHRG